MTSLVAKYWAPGQFPSGSSSVVAVSDERGFLADLLGPGQATLVLQNDSVVQPASDGIITFDVSDGVSTVRAFAALCEKKQRASIRLNKADEKTTWEMPGHLAVAKKGVIGPPGGVGKFPIADTVAYNWTHPDYDDSAWTVANAISFVGDAQLGGPNEWLIPWSDEWTEANSLLADIIGPSDGTNADVSSPNAANQIHYFRQTITITVAGRHKMAFSCDNMGEVYIDGLRIGTYDDWQHLVFFDVDLTVGTHVVGVALQNIPQADPNPCGYSWALYRPGYPPPFVARSTGASTVHVEYQAEPPGMTIGQVMVLAFTEHAGKWWADAILAAFTFDETNDSNGDPWATFNNITATVGEDTVLDVVEKLQANYADITIDPSSWAISAYPIGTFFPASGVTLDESNVTELTHRTEAPLATKLLVRSDALGWSSSGSGDVEAFLSLGSEVSAADVTTIAAKVIEKYGEERKEVEAIYAPDLTASPSEVPWVNANFVPGCSATAPDEDGSPLTERVQSLGCSVSSDAEKLQVQIILKDRIQELNERIIQELTG